MTKYILRHDFPKRLWHFVNLLSVAALMLTGLFVFIPYLTGLIGPDAAYVLRIIHRIVGTIFALAFVFYVLLVPRQMKHSLEHLFARWDYDDKLMAKRFPKWLFIPGLEMPKQGFVKSAQRVADLSMYLIIIFIAITGIILWIGVPTLPALLVRWALFGHDLCFFGLCLVLCFHVFFGAGVFKPYKGIHTMMLGHGYVKENDALEHWGHWAEEEMRLGKNVVEVKDESELPYFNSAKH